MKVKVCGLFRQEDIEYANVLRPDYIGFVFAASKRQIDEKLASDLKRKLRPEIKAVGVFVDEAEETIIRLLREGIIDVAQLHGEESEETIIKIKVATGKPVWKAIKVRSKEEYKLWENSNADCLVLDNGRGTGECFDWELLKEMKRAYFLAGGINQQNIEEAVFQIKPDGVDVSSGAETNGIKDFEKMRELIDCVRREER